MAHRLDETGGLQLQEDVWDDFGPAQHALQAAGLQDPVGLWEEEEQLVDEPANREFTSKTPACCFGFRPKSQTHRSRKGGKCLDTLFKHIMNLSSMLVLVRLPILFSAILRSS